MSCRTLQEIFRQPEESAWVLTSYLVSNAIILPISAWLPPSLGKRSMSCVALFTVSSFADSRRAWDFDSVGPWRCVGGGGLQPSEQAILPTHFPHPREWRSPYGMAVVPAPAIGP
jgi:DHA2 family multidrug resistance protein